MQLSIFICLFSALLGFQETKCFTDLDIKELLYYGVQNRFIVPVDGKLLVGLDKNIYCGPVKKFRLMDKTLVKICNYEQKCYQANNVEFSAMHSVDQGKIAIRFDARGGGGYQHFGEITFDRVDDGKIRILSKWIVSNVE
jgi:hypothetical protein